MMGFRLPPILDGRRWQALGLAAGLGLVACAAPPGAAPPAGPPPLPVPPASASPSADALLVIRGELSYRQRIALPPGALAVVEMRVQADAPAIAEQRIALDGRQVPVPFELRVERARFGASEVPLKGAILVGGQAVWETEAIPIPPVPGPVDLGVLWMRAVEGDAGPPSR